VAHSGTLGEVCLVELADAGGRGGLDITDDYARREEEVEVAPVVFLELALTVPISASEVAGAVGDLHGCSARRWQCSLQVAINSLAAARRGSRERAGRSCGRESSYAPSERRGAQERVARRRAREEPGAIWRLWKNRGPTLVITGGGRPTYHS
jgi:hypothetical protein